MTSLLRKSSSIFASASWRLNSLPVTFWSLIDCWREHACCVNLWSNSPSFETTNVNSPSSWDVEAAVAMSREALWVPAGFWPAALPALPSMKGSPDAEPPVLLELYGLAETWSEPFGTAVLSTASTEPRLSTFLILYWSKKYESRASWSVPSCGLSTL